MIREESSSMQPTLSQEELLLTRMTSRIRQSLELQEILDATVVEIRSFLNTDRIIVYRFQEDNSGQVIAESIAEDRLPSLVGMSFPAGDIPLQAREMYMKARQRSIIDVPNQKILLSQPNALETVGNMTLEEIRKEAIAQTLQRPVDSCHVEYLTTMGIQSSLVVPILHQGKLWGFISSHHSEPRQFSERELNIVQVLTDQVEIAITQAHLLSQSRDHANRQTLINSISTLLHAPLNAEQIQQTVLEKIVQSLHGSGGRLYLTSMDSTSPAHLYTSGNQPALVSEGNVDLLEDTSFWQQTLRLGARTNQLNLLPSSSALSEPNLPINAFLALQVVTDLYQEPQLASVASSFSSTKIRGILVMPLQYGQYLLGCLSVFRDEIDTETIWAGYDNSDERQRRPRQSFEAWRELKRGQAKPWTSEEIELMQSLGTHISMAVMQNRFYEGERRQRLLVEMRNQEINAARATAEEASRLKSDFLASTSHELRTPLASTLNYLKLLKEGFYDNEEELHEYINSAHLSAENLVAIINDVLDIAKIEAGHMTVSLEEVNLANLLQEQRNLFTVESRRKGVALIAECEVNNVYADVIKLKQIITNLLSNAFKFTEAGEIRIQAIYTLNKAWAEISVKDTGIGIENSKQKLVFEPFVQEDGSTQRQYGGTGLGLAICRRLVELMNGQIWLESAGKDQGTTVSLMLPCQKIED